MSETTDQAGLVRDIRRKLEPLPSMIMQGHDCRQELAEHVTELERVTVEPIRSIEAARTLLTEVSTWPDGTYLGHGRNAVTRVIEHLDLWLAEHPELEPASPPVRWVLIRDR